MGEMEMNAQLEFKEKGIIEFGKDFHPEFEGYIGEKETGVFISFIESKDKNKGNFSKLLEEFKVLAKKSSDELFAQLKDLLK
jgi:hypothetical protein